ncbi:HAD-IIIC family phosphatase [bacterium]|nr:HAD-IIIC family phosphatase [bacterium]
MTYFPWRPLPSEDWQTRLNNVADAAKSDITPEQGKLLALDLRRLANARLDMFQQIKLEQLMARLWPQRKNFGSLRPVKLGMAGNRTLSYLANALRAAAPARGLMVDCIEAPYDSAAALAMGRGNAFDGEAVDATLLMLDIAAFLSPAALLDIEAAEAATARAEEFLLRLAEGIKAQTKAPVIMATLPVPPIHSVTSVDGGMAGSTLHFIHAVNRLIHQAGAKGEWIVWDVATLASEIGTRNWFDMTRFYQAKTPFALELSPVVADHLCRLLAAMFGKASRALVLDLDNTLWGGVIGDDGVEGIAIGSGSATGEAHAALHQLALEYRRRGVVLAVCSKNTDHIAREPFEKHPDMLLKLDHIAVFQANWQDKATNIQAIAEQLSLGLESLVFVDDNPAERARVRQEFPQVQVPEVGENAANFASILAMAGYFEHLPLNNDDLKRAEAYQAEAKRAEIKSRVENYDDYLASLQMKMTIRPFDEIGRPRIAQLINKSNQFNLTTRRYNEDQITAFMQDKNILGWQVRLSDAFGDHGMIGVVIARKDKKHWEIDSWVMSCRVLERGVEHTIMNELIAAARAEGAESIDGIYLPTERNGLVKDFYPKLWADAPTEKPAGHYHLQTDAYTPHKTFIDVDNGAATPALKHAV